MGSNVPPITPMRLPTRERLVVPGSDEATARETPDRTTQQHEREADQQDEQGASAAGDQRLHTAGEAVGGVVPGLAPPAAGGRRQDLVGPLGDRESERPQVALVGQDPLLA